MCIRDRAMTVFEAVVASAVNRSRAALAAGKLRSHMMLFGDGVVVPLDVSMFPDEAQVDACRHERARLGASVVLHVQAATAQGIDIAMIYVESATEERHLIVARGMPEPMDFGSTDRIDFFAPADPIVA